MSLVRSLARTTTLPLLAAMAWGCGGDSGSGPGDPTATTSLVIEVGADAVPQPDSLVFLAIAVRGPRSPVDVILTPSDTGLMRVRPSMDGLDQDSLTIRLTPPASLFPALHFGTRPGRAVLRVRVPALGLVDSVVYALPTAVRLFYLLPEDTAAYVGDLLRLRYLAWAPTAGLAFAAPTLSTDRPDVLEITADGRVRTVAIGRARVFARCPGVSEELVDTAFVSVVPEGVITAWTLGLSGRVTLLEARGKPIRAFTPSVAYNITGLAWRPGGREFLYHADPVTLYVADTTGAARVLFVDSATGWSKAYPSPSADGEWVYYQARVGPTGDYNDQAVELWRVRADGTRPERVGEPAVTNRTHDVQPAISPDGLLLAYATNRHTIWNVGDVLRVRHTSTGAIDSLELPGNLPRWSPRGAVLAYYDIAWRRIYLVNADGTGQRPLTNVDWDGWREEFGWSPDGKWIVGIRFTVLTILNVETGEQLPVASARGFDAATWKP